MTTGAVFLVAADDPAALIDEVQKVSPWGNVEPQAGTWDDGTAYNTEVDVAPDAAEDVALMLERLGLRHEYLGVFGRGGSSTTR